MSLVEFLIFISSCAGITVLIVLSYVLDPAREFVSQRSAFLGKLLSCTMCTGFWVGVTCSAFFDINPVFAGAISSLFSWSIASVVDAFSTISLYLDSHLEDGD
tara:strand:+ start:501 stop:809 length:309 start_codon:yes stop_codon:yes gene_type:complete